MLSRVGLEDACMENEQIHHLVCMHAAMTDLSIIYIQVESLCN
jgi:hypothetical protein